MASKRINLGPKLDLEKVFNRWTTGPAVVVVGAMLFADATHSANICSVLDEARFIDPQVEVVKYKPLPFLPAQHLMCD